MTTSRVRVLQLVLCLLGAPLLVVPRVRAQMGPGMGFGAGYFDDSNDTAIHGVVQTVEHNAYSCRWGATEVTLQADKDVYVVQLGPTHFLSRNNFSIAKGDELRVRGFRFTCQGTVFLVAREMTRGGRTLKLRDAQGTSAWAGRGMGWKSASSWPGVGVRLCCGCRCRCW